MRAHVFTIAGGSFEVENGYASLNAYLEDVKRYGGIWDTNKRFYPYHAIHYFVDLSGVEEEQK